MLKFNLRSELISPLSKMTFFFSHFSGEIGEGEHSGRLTEVVEAAGGENHFKENAGERCAVSKSLQLEKTQNRWK